MANLTRSPNTNFFCSVNRYYMVSPTNFVIVVRLTVHYSYYIVFCFFVSNFF